VPATAIAATSPLTSNALRGVGPRAETSGRQERIERARTAPPRGRLQPC